MDWAQWWGPHFHGMWIVPFLFMILMCVVMFALLFRGAARGGFWHAHCPWSHADHGETARQILDRRYASGDLSKEQYDSMKRDIEQDRSRG